MSERPALAITGATGQLGGRIAHRLAARGVAQHLVARDPSRLPDLANTTAAEATYADGEAMRRALDGCRTLLLISAGEAANRVDHHRSAVDAAVAAGVERIVYTSFSGASAESTFTFGRDHWHTEQHIGASGVAHTFLRDNLYTDVLPYFVGDDGVIRGPAGDGRAAFVTRDDIADAAVEVLLGEGHEGKAYDMTGPSAISLAEAARLMSEATGRAISYHAETLEEAYASRAGYGAEDWAVAGWVTSYVAIANGELEAVSPHVSDLTGHEPASFSDYLAANPAVVSWLAGRLS